MQEKLYETQAIVLDLCSFFLFFYLNYNNTCRKFFLQALDTESPLRLKNYQSFKKFQKITTQKSHKICWILARFLDVINSTTLS